jgi:3-deoxy-manno-octulosonate cytidylyltransferase (CMP-KDO synthetase)
MICIDVFRLKLVKCVIVDYKGRPSMSGVDSLIDIERAEALIAKHGEVVQ